MIIWLASYPRSGNTLLRIILKSVFGRQTHSKHNDTSDIGADARTAEEVGHVNLPAAWAEVYPPMSTDEQIFLVKTHDAPEDEEKAIYVVRDGRSTCRSFYHYLKDFPFLTMEYTVRDVVSGFTPFGSWGEHLESWQPLTRPNTLLIKYEDLMTYPAAQIQRIADFTGLMPLTEWHNNFEALHEMNPRFFRAGTRNDPASALEGDDDDIFWSQHGDWMGRLGYPEPLREPGRARGVFRQFISRKGREQFFLREQLHFVGQEVGQLRARLAVEAEAQAEAQAASVARIAGLEDALHALRQELDESKSLCKAVRAELTDAKAVGEDLEGVRRELADAREARAELERIRSELSEALASKAELQRAQRELTAAQQADEERFRGITSELAEARLAASADAERARQLDARLLQVSSDLAHAKNRIEEQQRLLEEAGELSATAASEYSRAMADNDKAVQLLLGATQTLEDRVRMLVSSRLMRLGWRLGLGSEPSWADPTQDELTVELKALRNSDGHGNGRPAETLARIQSLSKLRSARDAEMNRALQHLFDKGFRPDVVLDIGAAKGYWTLKTAWRWQQAEFYLIDPLHESEAELQKVCQNPRFHYLLTAVGAEPGELVMHLTDDFDGSTLLAFPDPDPPRERLVSVTTIDALLASGALKPPQLVKMDVQGFEINVLKGGQRMFDTAEVFILEVSLFRFMRDCPLADEVIRYMAERNFHVFDLAGQLRRPRENDLGQMDLVFVSERSPMVSSNRWE